MKNLAIVGGIILLIAIFAIGGVNGIVRSDEDVKGAWSQVQNQYQRRADLIPNLVNVVKGYAAHEKETLQAVVDARARATNTNVNIDDQTQAEKYMQTQQQLTGALSRLMVVVEKYPDLKASENFLTLQAQIEGTENRIAVARMDYVEKVQKFNKTVRTFPGVIWSSISGLSAKPTFTAEPSAQSAPVVAF